MMQLRPRGILTPEQSLFHNPARDLAYRGPEIYCSAIKLLLDPSVREPWMTEYLGRHGITDAELLEALAAFRSYFQHAADPAVKKIDEAIERAGVWGLRECVRLVIFARVGQIITGLLMPYMRQVAAPDQPPMFKHMDELFAGVEAAVASMTRPDQEDPGVSGVLRVVGEALTNMPHRPPPAAAA